MIGLADFDRARHAADDFLRARRAPGAGRDNGDGTGVTESTLAAVAKLGDESDRNSRDRSFDRHAGIHEREHAAAHAGHRAGAVRFHDFARDADGVTEILGAGNHGLERALGERSMTDLATAGAACPSGFAYAEWREA